MRKIILCVIFLALSNFLFGQDVRNVYWGMSPKEVREVETAYYIRSGPIKDSLSKVYEEFAISFAGVDWELTYIFKYSQLDRVDYISEAEDEKVYKRIEEMLIEKYGETIGNVKNINNSHWWNTERSSIAFAMFDGKIIITFFRKDELEDKELF